MPSLAQTFTSWHASKRHSGTILVVTMWGDLKDHVEFCPLRLRWVIRVQLPFIAPFEDWVARLRLPLMASMAAREEVCGLVPQPIYGDL